MTGNTSNSGLRRWVAPAVWVYFTILFGWLAGYLLLGDGLPHLALVNALAVYLFFPLPLALAARGPVLVVGDVNAAPLSTAYKIIRSGGLEDAWAQAGWGLGHTFPGAQNEASSRPGIGPLNAPQWLVRIDYVFFSEHFTAVEARTARFDGVSDHRGVVARLAIQYADGGGQYTDGTDRGG